MKKQALLFLAGGIMAMASCTTETANNTSQEQIDSMVNARVEEIRTEMMRSNDSLINAMAQMKADSMIAAMKGGAPVTAARKPAPGKTKNDGTNHGTIQDKPRQDPGAVTTRPGATNSGEAKPVTDRPGATNSGQAKPVTDRPGAK